MKPGDLYKVKTEFYSREKPTILVKENKILMFIKKEIEIDNGGKHRRYFFLYQDRVLSFSLGYAPVQEWVEKYV